MKTWRRADIICLGHTESMSRISPLFEVCRFADAIVYRGRWRRRMAERQAACPDRRRREPGAALLSRHPGAAGFEVDEALNGLEALEKLLANPADLLIVDINMPQMDGIRS